MSDNPFFSVVVLTYNSSWVATRRTLYSLLIQKNCDFEIVIADDGSKDNNFDKIREYFSESKFNNFQLIENKDNQGTVKNFYSGLIVSKGEYVKAVSPGDYLYDENTLYCAAKYIKKNDAAVYFGRAFFYALDDDKPVVYKDRANPFDITPYQKHNNRKIKKNYLLNHDYISGATTIYKKNIFIKYIEKILPIVRFAEDYTIAYMIACKETVKCLLNENNQALPIVWYECAGGISTNINSKWHQILVSENINVYKLLLNEKRISKKIYQELIKDITEEKSIRIKFIKYLHHPWLMLNKIRPRENLKGWNNEDFDIDKLNAILDSSIIRKRSAMISIAMTTYNGEKYLREQLDSILNQSYKDIELIICDDKSTDNTKEILTEYEHKDKRIKVYFNEENLGFKRNFAKAISLCSGEYIAFSDQDDVWVSNKLQISLDNIKDAAFICTDSKVVDENLKPLGYTLKECLGINELPTERYELIKNFVHHNFVQGATILAKSEFIKSWLPIPEAIRFHDWYFALCAALDGRRIEYLDEPTLLYRQHGGNVTTNVKRNTFEQLKPSGYSIEKYKAGSIQEADEKLLYIKIISEKILEPELQKYLNDTILYFKSLPEKKFYILVYKNKYYHYMLWELWNHKTFKKYLLLLKNLVGYLLFRIKSLKH